MEHLIVEVLATLLDIIGEFVLQMLFELAANALSGLIKPGKQSSSAVSFVGVAFAGLAPSVLPLSCLSFSPLVRPAIESKLLRTIPYIGSVPK